MTRKNRHELARQYMLNNDYSAATQELESILSTSQPYILILSDLTASYYMTQQMDMFVRSFHRLEREFAKAQDHLSVVTHLKALLIISKFQEELGDIDTALKNYHLGFNLAKDNKELKLEQKFAIQLLRLQSWLHINENLHELYLRCYNYSEVSTDLLPELEHGLILAEQTLFGDTVANARLKNALTNKNCLISDLRLMYFDFAEELILKNSNLNLLTETKFTDPDQFEQQILLFLKKSDYFLPYEEIVQLDKKTSPLCLMRLIALSLNRLQNLKNEFENVSDLKRKFLFLLNALDTNSQKILKKKWQKLLVGTGDLSWSEASSNLYCDSRVYNLSHSQFACACFNILFASAADNISTEQIINQIYGLPMDESTYARLKTAVQRLNREIEKELGICKPILLDKNLIKINKPNPKKGETL